MSPKTPDINDKDFIRKVMSLGFLGYISKGIGCILIKEPAKLNAPNASEELLDYIPYDDSPTFPQEAVRMMNYDPMNAVVLATHDTTHDNLDLARSRPYHSTELRGGGVRLITFLCILASLISPPLAQSSKGIRTQLALSRFRWSGHVGRSAIDERMRTHETE